RPEGAALIGARRADAQGRPCGAVPSGDVCDGTAAEETEIPPHDDVAPGHLSDRGDVANHSCAKRRPGGPVPSGDRVGRNSPDGVEVPPNKEVAVRPHCQGTDVAARKRLSQGRPRGAAPTREAWCRNPPGSSEVPPRHEVPV